MLAVIEPVLSRSMTVEPVRLMPALPVVERAPPTVTVPPRMSIGPRRPIALLTVTLLVFVTLP